MTQLKQVGCTDIARLKLALEQSPGKVVFAKSLEEIQAESVPASDVFRGPFRQMDAITGYTIMGEDVRRPLQPLILGITNGDFIIVREDKSLIADGWKPLHGKLYRAYIPEAYFEET